jgi:predicted RNA-binding protein with PUA-like domain
MKCEPGAYSIDDLERDGVTSWEGVRNFQARNSMRDDMKVGDGVLFYASNADPSGVTGVAEVAREGYPDPFAFEEGHVYFDEKSDPANPTWISVDIRFVERFPGIVPLEVLKGTPGLEGMMVTKKGSRLSVQPVAPGEFEIVRGLGRLAEATPLATKPAKAEKPARSAGPTKAGKPAKPKTPKKAGPAKRAEKAAKAASPKAAKKPSKAASLKRAAPSAKRAPKKAPR